MQHLHLTGSGVALGIVVGLQFLPMLLFGPFGGLVADRTNKRTLLFATQTGGGVLAQRAAMPLERVVHRQAARGGRSSGVMAWGSGSCSGRQGPGC